MAAVDPSTLTGRELGDHIQFLVKEALEELAYLREQRPGPTEVAEIFATSLNQNLDELRAAADELIERKF